MQFTRFTDPYELLEDGTAPNTPTSTKPAPTPPTVNNKQPAPSTPPQTKGTGMNPAPKPSTMGRCASGGFAEDFSLIEPNSVHQDRVMKIIREYMDMSDYETVMQATSLNEAEQNTFLVSLTNKLYQMIVSKIDDVDFGDIPQTKGNVRKLPKYKQMRECIEVLHDIFVQYKEDTKPIDEIDNALSNVENNADLFMASYAGQIQLGIMIYETTTLGIVNAIGFLIATCIEYVKDPKKQGLEIVLKKTGIKKVKDHLVYENLLKFNEACKKGELEKAVRPLIKNNVKDLIGGGIVFAIHATLAIGVIIAAIIPFLRQLTYFFYASRVRMSTYLDAQADLLEMNAMELKNNPHITTEDEKSRVIARQLKIARTFHDTANAIAIDSKNSENNATKELKTDDKKYKMDEVESNPANSTVDGPLF